MSSSIPLPALAVQPPPQQESPVNQYAKLVQLKSLLGQQQLQQQELQQRSALAPLQLQQQQIATKQAQIDLQDKQGMSQALLDSYGKGTSQPATQGGAAPSETGSSQDRLGAFMNAIQDPKYGISAQGQMGLIENFNKMRAQIATTDKATLDATQAANNQFVQHLGTVLDAPPEDQAALWTVQRNAIMRDPTLAKYGQQIPSQFPGEQQATTILHSLMLNKDLLDTLKSQAELPGQKAKSQQDVLAASPANAKQVADAVNTLKTYSAIPANMRNGFATQMMNAPNYATLQDLQKRADAAQESFQRSADARQQAMALRDVAIGQAAAVHLINEDKALQTSLNATGGIRAELDMSKGGNQMASNAAITRFAEHEVKEGGINRFNETELNAMGKDAGSWGRQIQTWYDKGAKGTPPAGTVGDINAILDVEDRQAHSLHDQNVEDIQNRFSDITKGGSKKAPAKSSDPFAPFGGKMHTP